VLVGSSYRIDGVPARWPWSPGKPHARPGEYWTRRRRTCAPVVVCGQYRRQNVSYENSAPGTGADGLRCPLHREHPSPRLSPPFPRSCSLLAIVLQRLEAMDCRLAVITVTTISISTLVPIFLFAVPISCYRYHSCPCSQLPIHIGPSPSLSPSLSSIALAFISQHHLHLHTCHPSHLHHSVPSTPRPAPFPPRLTSTRTRHLRPTSHGAHVT